MGRRGRREGAVYYDKDRDRWVGSADVGRADNGRRLRRKVSGRTKTECRANLDQLRAELQVTRSSARRDITVGEIVAEWIGHPPPELRSSITLQLYARTARRITGVLGPVPGVTLTPRRVEAFLTGLARDGKSASTIRQTRMVLRRALRRAVRDGLVARNAAELADMPRARTRRSRAMTLAEIGRLLEQEMTPWWRAYLTVAIGCGLRPGEMLGLGWEDIEDDTIRVRRALHEEPGPDGRIVLIVADLKTESSKRTLRMPPTAAGALRALRVVQLAERLEAGARWDDHGLVFCGKTGRPRWPGKVRIGFRDLCKTAGLGSDWHPHEQRHTFVSVLSDAGESIESIAAAVGHRSPKTTRGTYWHVIAPVVESAPGAMNGVLSTPPGEPG
jgi:integrase